jgi:hypothetical protein
VTGRREEEGAGAYGDKPAAEPIDKESEQRELEEAGWERIERLGKTVWRNPHSGHLYPQGAAIALLRAGRFSEAAEEGAADGS